MRVESLFHNLYHNLCHAMLLFCSINHGARAGNESCHAVFFFLLRAKIHQTVPVPLSRLLPDTSGPRSLIKQIKHVSFLSAVLIQLNPDDQKLTLYVISVKHTSSNEVCFFVFFFYICCDFYSNSVL